MDSPGHQPRAGLGAPAPVEDFFRDPQVRNVELSPSGRYLAVESQRDNGRVQLIVIDLENPSDARTVAGFGDVDVVGARWVNDRRLLFAAADLRVNWDDWRSNSQGWCAVNRDGTRLRKNVLKWGWPVQTLDDDSNDVIAERSDGKDRDENYTLWRIDTLSGKDTLLSGGLPESAHGWVVDEQGQLRAFEAYRESRSVLSRHDTDKGSFAEVFDQSRFGERALEPLAYRHGKFYVTAHNPKTGMRSLYGYDLEKARREDAPLVQVEGFDFVGEPVFDDASRRLVGVWHLTDDWSITWLDEDMKALQARIDARLPGLVNNVLCKRCLSARRVLVASYSDRLPTTYTLFDRQTGALSIVARSRPWISPKDMSARETVRFPARDGLSIPLTITRPPAWREGDAPPPAVVLIHGGPFVRGATWGWSDEAQFLASRGYVVLEPEFRGSTGFGAAHFRAGFKQWGLAMQDDIADTARWAAEQKIIDPKRVCLMGASYGGYATLMGLIRHPEQFRCGVNWLGVTDIELMYSIGRSDLGTGFKRYGLPTLVADKDKDARQIEATSPLRQATRLKQPLLMAYGGQDKRVPIEHGLKMRDALKAHNPAVEWVEYRPEGHGWALLETRVDFWTRVEAFLAKHLK